MLPCRVRAGYGPAQVSPSPPPAPPPPTITNYPTTWLWTDNFTACGANEVGCTSGGIRAANWGFQNGDGCDLGLCGWGEPPYRPAARL